MCVKSKQARTEKQEGMRMDRFRTVISVIGMVLAGMIGYYFGAALGESMGCAILFSVITGFAGVIYVLDNPRKQ